jgi:predicted component of type VI protein secretion system
MPAQLVALDDSASILLDKPILLLGRHPECDIQIDSRKISRRHCCIAQVSDYLVVRDLGSTNGIRINGVRLIEGRLASGDELTIGNNRYKVSWDGAAVNPPRPPKKQTFVAPTPKDAVPDDLLESCDEPIPLAEPEAADAIAPSVAASEAPPAGSAPIEEKPFILPDELELLPNSDVYPKLSPHESGSHPPA